MTIRTHILGFPRIGAARELKSALENHWRGEMSEAALEATGRQLRARHWALQRDAGLACVTVGDFAFYDQVASHIQLLGCEPARFRFDADQSPLSRYFTMARGEIGKFGQWALTFSLSSLPLLVNIMIYLVLVPILVFFYMGFEHSIVNMYLFPSGLMLGGNFTFMDYMIWNEIPTVLGNLVGGLTFVGATLYSTHYKTAPKRRAA